MRETHPSNNTLPRVGLKVVELDITPVPGYARSRNPAWIAWLVNHTSVSNRLWNMHEIFIADIITNLGRWFEILAQRQQPLLRVVGTISPKTRTRLPTVFQRLDAFPRWGGLDAVFESDYVDDAGNLRWETLLEILQGEYEVTPPGDLRDEKRIVKDKLRKGFQEDQPFRSLFNKVALQQPEWVRTTVLDLAGMAAGGGKWIFQHWSCRSILTCHRVDVGQIMRYVQLAAVCRAFLHQLAEHLGLASFSEDQDGGVKTVFVHNKSVGNWHTVPWGAQDSGLN